MPLHYFLYIKRNSFETHQNDFKTVSFVFLFFTTEHIRRCLHHNNTSRFLCLYDSEGNGRLISQADDGNWYDSDGNCYGSWEDIGRAMDEDGVTDQDGNKYYWTWTAPDDA